MSRRRYFRALAGAAIACSLAFLSPVAVAAEPDDAALFAAMLSAGEFGPAKALAEASGPAVRDHRLRELAVAQAGAGARRASIDTASYIGDDLVRSQAAQQISQSSTAAPAGHGGGAGLADFDSLIDLIITTVAPETWDDVGGPGSVAGFEGGVYVDAEGVLKKMDLRPGEPRLTAVRSAALLDSGNTDCRRPSTLRKVSLTRLEKQAQLLAAAGESPDAAMRHLAGINRVQYVFVYPETGDIVIAGPAGDWRDGAEGRAVSVDGGRPTLHLDDVVVMLRNAQGEAGRFGCSITPKKENLARTQAYLDETSKSPLRPGTRDRWLGGLRDALGRQTIEVYGIDPRTRAGQILVEADYRMKLVGMGLEEGTLDVESYLASIAPDKDGKLPPMDVIRWWFTLNYKAVTCTESRDGYEIHGQGVKVLSENELLTETGERIATGKSDELTAGFAHAFTNHFGDLAAKYPVYAELQNVFDLALVSSLIVREDLPGQVGWHLTYFGAGGDGLKYRPQLGAVPAEVESIVNHRMLGRQIVAGVSGGVQADAGQLVHQDAIRPVDDRRMRVERLQGTPPELKRDAWWWD